MHRLMYGDWEKFSAARLAQHGTAVREGFVGNTVIIKRSALARIGLWDERINWADFDLFLRTRQRHREKGDIQPVHIVFGVFHHHYIRMTLKSRPPVFKDADKIIQPEEKWGREEIAACEQLLKSLNDQPPHD
jgi:hypothetical protein